MHPDEPYTPRDALQATSYTAGNRYGYADASQQREGPVETDTTILARAHEVGGKVNELIALNNKLAAILDVIRGSAPTAVSDGKAKATSGTLRGILAVNADDLRIQIVAAHQQVDELQRLIGKS